MEASNKKDQYRALLGTILFHAVLLVCCLFFALSTSEIPEEHGVIVSLGYTDEGTGARQPLSEPAPEPQEATPTSADAAEEIVTQETQEAIALPDESDAQEDETVHPDPEPVEEPSQEAEETVEEQVEEEETRQEVDERALYPGRDQRSTERQDQGETGEEGDQGEAEGVTDADAFDGSGPGDGIEYSLSGRQANYLPVPEYTTQATGRVVVEIVVDRQGNVIRATPGVRGTTTTNQTLHSLAEEAAMEARFDIKADAPAEQRGSITYNFIRLN